MGRELNMDTQRQNFWKESINKEAYVRLNWHARYSKEFSRSAYVPKPRKEGMVIKPVASLTLPSKKLDSTTVSKTKLQDSIAQFEAAAKEDPNSLLIEMRPVSSNTKKLLYNGFSALGEGRYQYLEKRKMKKPEQKYEFPITSAWEIGWKIDEYCPTMKAAQFGRTKVIRDSFYRNNGIFYNR
ncbi:protein ATP6V1FNB-like [Nematostella vectensis]|uniref:protein ATP6V1FNB-like n=1 Tax=Nematostella vectensis TaxID=45351 RepID=UPI00138FBDB8|nr:protein ATP6V1FNB-like [Nematostella vectensis]